MPKNRRCNVVKSPLFCPFSGDKPFSCDICQKKFALSCNLRAHLKTHEAEFQSSQASLALYQRALAVLGQQQQQAALAGPSSPEEEPEGEEPEGEEGGSPQGSHMEEGEERENSNILVKSEDPSTSPASSPPIELPKLTVAV